jgi:hypothetical protein
VEQVGCSAAVTVRGWGGCSEGWRYEGGCVLVSHDPQACVWGHSLSQCIGWGYFKPGLVGRIRIVGDSPLTLQKFRGIFEVRYERG